MFSVINEEFAPQYLGKDEVPEKLERAIRQFTTGVDEPADNPAEISNVKPIGRNEPCACGSGKRYKHCHGKVA